MRFRLLEQQKGSLDYDERDQALFNEPVNFAKYSKSGGIRYFERKDAEEMEDLADRDFIDLEDRQNNSPTAREFIEFCWDYPDVLMHGYAVSPRRSDVGIIITGLQSDEPLDKETLNAVRDFVKPYRPEEYQYKNGKLWVWWD